ncbi:low-density lipoprotein receptor class a [Octopus vulgaris]|uniref:Low-density lipoprotein receptor class a n=2 Tax=Octopus TaxID=6643 RepID=A0AA36F997_OCTVU|nr:formin-like protein 18 [Octopus sinensis]CAI9730551.1 low-density lipoprotein receptor class a [Octopus vulgaris]
MYSNHWIKTPPPLLLFLLCCLVVGTCQFSEPKIKILPKWRLKKVKGSNLQMKCVVNSVKKPPIFMKWLFISVDRNDTLACSRGNNSVSLNIKKLKILDAGAYICVVKLANGKIVNKDAVVFILDKEMPGPCSEHQFLCQTSRLCIAKKFLCNRVNDCTDKSDEKDCEASHPTYAVTKHPDTELDGQAFFMQTAVYSVIGCAIGVILLISVLIIAVFRVRMKRAAVRRAMAPNDSGMRGNAATSAAGGSSAASGSNSVPPEYDPFLSPSSQQQQQQQQPSSSSSSQFGNIIVNVNNGVQYVPGSDFPQYIEPPPPYSTVVAGRECSPPPPYSTIDPSAPPLPPLPPPPPPPSSSAAAASSPILNLSTPTQQTEPPERITPLLPPPRSMSALTPPILADPTQTGELPRTLPAQLSAATADGHALPGHIIVKDGKIILTPRNS